jgi:hypothetical protein
LPTNPHAYVYPSGTRPIDTTDRLDLATYLASRVPTLQRIGFEYRCPASSFRYEDRWVDWEVERRPAGALQDGFEGDSDAGVRLWELRETWYVFPEVWKEEALVQ